ncbi:hypothetical protein PR202_ga14143 [Eleusine coracana subsp. coracana]|uniref:Pirin-like protein n=1 Tax=Eleusine coracana subsp. coracana TaxID=191504 RepID=A0AAV5CGS0_ELECO|nr:hypothetical protein PR202_ga14143 [Eleusine coracana subsp. coracana]
MTTTVMRHLAYSSSSIYTSSALARIRTSTHHLSSQLQKRTRTSNKLLLFLLIVPLVLVFLIAIVFLLPARIMSSSSDAVAAFEKPRMVVKKILAESQPEGQGATVRRSIGRPELRNLDPFLMLDEFSVSKPAGFPDHPHRGFETVTYMLEGAFTHQDFAGHKGTIHAGDVQVRVHSAALLSLIDDLIVQLWMTAGRGIVHSEMPAGDGVQKGLQLWINLSSKDKMIEPQYQELQSKDISRAEKDGVEVKIIAGEAFGPVPEGWNAFVYIIDGEGVFGREKAAPVSAHHCVVLGPGDGLSVWNKSDAPLRFALIGGQPLNEPVVQHGPFVMNTRAQIQQAMEDYYYGRNGFEKAGQWSSSA